MHTLIIGSSDTNRAALIDRLLAALDPKPKLYGYRSVKEEPGADGRCPIYIYPADGPRRRGADNLLGWCKNRQSETYPEAFDRNAGLIEAAKPGGLLVMDEIGPMESRSVYFRKAVLNALKDDVPILATVRDKDNPFLNEVRGAANARRFWLTQENTEAVFQDTLQLLKEQMTK